MADVVVIGGGISGMSFAWFCAKAGKRVVVLERASQAGGCLQSLRTDDDYWLEIGAHTCYNSYGTLLELIEDTCGLSRLIKRKRAPFRLFTDGEVQSIAKKVGVLELLRSVPRLFSAKKQGRSVRQYYSEIVGEENYRTLFSPLFAAVPSQPADDFPAEMLFKKRPRRKDVHKSFTVQGGLQSITDAIARHPRIDLHTDSGVTSVDEHDGRVVVETEDGQRFEGEKLALAVPPSVGSQLLKEHHAGIADLLSQINVQPITSTAVVLQKLKLKLESVAGIVPVDDDFYSVVSRDVIPHPTYRGFAFHFKPQFDQQHRLKRISEVLRVDQSAFVQTTSREVVLPSPIVGHGQLVDRLERELRRSTLFITGNYFLGLSIEDCVQRSQLEAQRLLSRR